MGLALLSQQTTRKICEALGEQPDKARHDQIAKIVDNALLQAASRVQNEYREAAVICCGHEADMAHKIAEEMERKRIALVANLASMR